MLKTLLDTKFDDCLILITNFNISTTIRNERHNHYNITYFYKYQPVFSKFRRPPEILDQEIGKRDEYMNIKESKIDSLRKLIKKDIPLGEEYRINKQIFEEYHTYKYDSAMYYIARNKEIADFMENNKYKDEVRISQSQLLSTAGLINESITNISQLDRSKLDNSLLLIYYETMESIYYTAKNYSNDSIYTPQYEKIERAYIDSVYSLLPEGSINQIYYSGYKRLVNNQLEEAKEILLNLLENLPENVRLYAIICSNLATINRLQDNNRDYEKYLILLPFPIRYAP